ncbi:MAG: alpha/beta hydrolase [Mucinivorans sp.]
MEIFIMASGVATRYADFGKGEKVVVLLHGYLEAIEVFDSFAGELGKTYRVICIDLPGHGLSDWGGKEAITVDFSASVVASVLEKVGIMQASVVGHSMGGYVAVALAENYPQLVSQLVLLHSSPAGDSQEKKEYRQREIELIQAGKKELLATVNPAKGFAKINHKRCAELIENLHEQVMMTDDKAIVATLCGLMERKDRSEFFATTNIPRLMVFGTDDNYIPREAAQTMIERFPKAKYEWVEMAGHSSFAEQPSRTAEIIRNFIPL